MGNNKNSRGSHACRGKYVKKTVPAANNKNSSSLIYNRIIKLDKLHKHLQVISQHATTCQLCAVNAVSGKEAIVLVGEQNCQGLCSILTSRCVGCNKEF